jgi:SAM-dependent methyltransferase
VSEPEYSYVTRDFETLTGEEARRLVEQTNDTRFLTADGGIHTVTLERWKLAQDAERHHWLDLRPHVSEDRNMDHAFMFDRYELLRDRVFANAIELGCGPFTNIAVLAQLCKIERLTLLDPLIEDYLTHKNCRYRTGTLTGNSGVSVPVAERVALPIEQFEPKIAYDLVVMLNVIEHCYDVPLIFRRIWEMTAPGGLVFFHDRYFDHAQVADEARRSYDAAHPLKVDRRLIEAFIARFEEVFFRLINTEGHAIHSGTGDQVYFIGRKPG